jgi:hypothetical protein
MYSDDFTRLTCSYIPQVRNRTAKSKLSRVCSNRKGVSASPDKIKVMRVYPTPKNVKDVREFLGLASFYRRLVQDFATVAKFLTELTKKDRSFSWGSS